MYKIIKTNKEHQALCAKFLELYNSKEQDQKFSVARLVEKDTDDGLGGNLQMWGTSSGGSKTIILTKDEINDFLVENDIDLDRLNGKHFTNPDVWLKPQDVATAMAELDDHLGQSASYSR